MLTLTLLRHAKTERDAPDGGDDSQRRLTSRGRTDAPAMARLMAREAIVPDLVLCSTAARTRETLDLVMPHFPRPPQIAFDDGLYLASPAALLDRVRAVNGPVRGRPTHILIVGHNPGLQMLALEMIQPAAAHAPAILELATNLPTAGLVVIDIDAARWSAVETARGNLRHFATPRRMPQE